jgi:hypothetical protein
MLDDETLNLLNVTPRQEEPNVRNVANIPDEDPNVDEENNKEKPVPGVPFDPDDLDGRKFPLICLLRTQGILAEGCWICMCVRVASMCFF